MYIKFVMTLSFTVLSATISELFPPLFPTLTSVLLSYALRPSLLLSQVNLRLIKKVTPMTLTTWQFTSWYYVNAQHLSFSTTLHFVAQPLSSFSILGCHHLNEGAINYKRAIVVDCDCFHLLLSYMLSHHPSCSLTLCPSLLRSILLYLAPPHLISYSKQKENTERSPIVFFPVHVFQTAFSLINWGKWLRTSAPGPVPYIPFSFALMSSASYLITLSSRGFTSPSPSSPFPFLLSFSLLYIPLFFLYMLSARKTWAHWRIL